MAMRRIELAVCAAVLATAAPVGVAQDCARPKSVTERMICSNDRVSEANQRMAFAFLNAYRRTTDDAKRAEIRARQREWEASERDVCMDVPCLLRAFDDRTLELEQN